MSYFVPLIRYLNQNYNIFEPVTAKEKIFREIYI